MGIQTDKRDDWSWAATGDYRFATPPGTTSLPPVFQRRFENANGASEWRAVPLVVDDSLVSKSEPNTDGA